MANEFFKQHNIFFLMVPEEQLKQIGFIGDDGSAEFYRFIADCNIIRLTAIFLLHICRLVNLSDMILILL